MIAVIVTKAITPVFVAVFATIRTTTIAITTTTDMIIGTGITMAVGTPAITHTAITGPITALTSIATSTTMVTAIVVSACDCTSRLASKR